MTAVEHDAVAQTDAVAHARATISAGIRLLRAATDGDDVQRARAYTAVLRDFVGAGGARAADGPDAGWVTLLRTERQAALRRLAASGRDVHSLAALCWMTRTRVGQLLDGGRAGSSRVRTGRPTGRPARTKPAAD